MLDVPLIWASSSGEFRTAGDLTMTSHEGAYLATELWVDDDNDDAAGTGSGPRRRRRLVMLVDTACTNVRTWIGGWMGGWPVECLLLLCGMVCLAS